MKLPSITLVLSLSILDVFGQTTQNTTIDLSAGHEQNVFLNPDLLETDDEVLDRTDLWDNGTYQALSLRHVWKTKQANHTWKLGGGGGLGLYQTEMNANRYALHLEGSFRTKYGPRKYLEVAPTVSRKKRSGVNVSDAVLQTPFSYLLAEIPIHADFYLGSKSWLKTEVGYRYKNYDQTAGERLYYHAPFLQALISKKWVAGGWTHKLYLSTDAMLRRYRDVERSNDEGEDEALLVEKVRKWNYSKQELGLLLSGKKLGITAAVHHLRRKDLSGSNSYREFAPLLEGEYRMGKLRMQGGMSFSHRNYDTITPGRGNDDLVLAYQYFRFNGQLQYFLEETVRLYLKGRLVRRLSNNPDPGSIAFQEYFTSNLQAGLSIQL